MSIFFQTTGVKSHHPGHNKLRASQSVDLYMAQLEEKDKTIAALKLAAKVIDNVCVPESGFGCHFHLKIIFPSLT